MNIHLHCLVLDGAYRRSGNTAAFQAARTPTTAELEGFLVKIITRLMRMLTRSGYLVEEEGMSYLADIDADMVVDAATLIAECIEATNVLIYQRTRLRAPISGSNSTAL